MAGPKLTFVNITDRPMVTLDLDVEQTLRTGEPYYSARRQWKGSLKGAIIRVQGEATEDQAEQLAAGGARLLRAVTDKLKDGGAHKVIGPKLKIIRERRARSEVTAETTPAEALDQFVAERDLEPKLHKRVMELAREVMTGG